MNKEDLNQIVAAAQRIINTTEDAFHLREAVGVLEMARNALAVMESQP